jgi:hypothetical protein
MAHKLPAPDDVSFGPKLKFSSIRKVDYTVTDDKKSFAIAFAPALAAGVGSPVFDGLKKSRAPIGTNLYSAVVPASGRSARMSIVLNGFGAAEPGTHATVVIMANGQHGVTHFDALDEAFTASLAVRAKALAELRLSVLIVVERQADHPGASALFAVNDISVDTFVPRKKAARKSTKKSR